jgi:heme-degrading monooxygenase HmoA
VTLINVFSCEPESRQDLIDAWIRAAVEMLGKLPGILSAALHRSKDGIRVVSYSQWRSSEGWEKLLEIGKKSYFGEVGEVREAGGTPLRGVFPRRQKRAAL